MKLQAGMAFECELEEKKIKGRILKLPNVDGKYTLRYMDEYGEPNFWNFDKIESELIENFRIIPITLDLLQVGDVVIDPDENELTILSRVNDLVHLSEDLKPTVAQEAHYTIDELKKLNFSVIQPDWEEKPKARGMTLREIELELGYKIRIEED